jgi:hypothetical protein
MQVTRLWSDNRKVPEEKTTEKKLFKNVYKKKEK